MPLNLRNINSIEAHEQSIGSALRETSDRFKAISRRLDQFKTASVKSDHSLKATQWLKQRQDSITEEQKLTKQAKVALKKIEGSGSANRPKDNNSLLHFTERIVLLFRQMKQGDSSPSRVKSLRKYLVTIEKELQDEQMRLTKELENISETLKSHKCSNETQVLPLEIVEALDALKAEFDLVLSEEYIEGMGPVLEEDIQILAASIASNFKRFNGVDVDNKARPLVHVVENKNEWSERCQLVLRSAFKQWWTTKRNINEKKSVLAKVAAETGITLTKCKAEWQALELSIISKNRDKGSRLQKKNDRNELLRLGLEDISKMRQDTIHSLVQVSLVNLNDEISLEREYKLELLRSLQRQIEERQRDELRRNQELEKEESLQLRNKRQSELLSKREKLRVHLEFKEKEVCLSRLEDLKRRNDEEETRIKRLPMNKER